MENIVKEKLKKYLKVEEETASSLFEQLALYIYSLEAEKHDLYILAKLLPEKEISKLVAYFDGDIIKLPTKKEHRTLLLLGVCYYLKEIKRFTWEEIKTFLDLPENNQDLVSSISLGGKINKLNEKISKEWVEMLRNIKVLGLDEFAKGVKNEK